MVLTINPYNDSKYSILRNFDLNNYKKSKLKFCDLVLINDQNYSVATSALLPEQFYTKSFKNTKCVKRSIENPNIVHIGNPTYSIYSNIKIVPLGIGFTNKEGAYQGALCTGLRIYDLNIFLEESIDKQIIKYIALKNLDHLPAYKTLSNNELLQIIINYKKNNIIFPLGIKNYALSLSLNKDNIKYRIYQKLLLVFIIELFSVFIIYILYYLIKRSFINPLSSIKNNLLNLPTYRNTSFQSKQEELYFAITTLITENQNIYHKQQQDIEQQKKEYLEKQVLYSALLERNYTPENFQRKFNEAHLIKKALHHISKDKKQNVIIENSIGNIIDYCQEYFEIEIILSSFIENNYKMILNNNAFEDSVFLLIFFILRCGLCSESEPIKIIINGDVPKITITIKAVICVNQRSITWENHPTTSFSSLYTIMLLFKENSFFLDLHKENNCLCFSISTIN